MEYDRKIIGRVKDHPKTVVQSGYDNLITVTWLGKKQVLSYTPEPWA